MDILSGKRYSSLDWKTIFIVKSEYNKWVQIVLVCVCASVHADMGARIWEIKFLVLYLTQKSRVFDLHAPMHFLPFVPLICL